MGARFSVLGPLEIQGDDTAELTRPSHRRLLAILVLGAGRRISTDALIDRFWADDPPERAKAALQTHLSDLRRRLPPDVVLTEGHGYRLDLGEHDLDVHAFEDLAARAGRHHQERDWARVLEVAEDALALWRGGPYTELRDDAYARPEITRLEERRLELLAHLVDALLATGREGDAVGVLEPLVAEHPLRERSREQLMLARYRLGRHAEALETYHELRAELDELGLEPGEEVERLQRRILNHDDRLRGGRAPTNLPVELTSFVGRERELVELDRLLGDHRLVTLTGVGGSGKSRLALQAAMDRLDRHADGAWIVELAAVEDPELVADRTAATLGVRADGDAAAALRTAVAQRELLVVLDNGEHLRTAAAEVAALLVGAGPNVSVLVTSRVPLGVPGEVVYDVPPLGASATHPGAPLELGSGPLGSDAVRLFDERAAEAWSGYRPSQPEVVATICRRLDGLPLAIELAAAQVRTLGVRELADRLHGHLMLLADPGGTRPERHRTLAATIAWSYDLLDAQERQVFARLSVFRGAFDLTAAQAIAVGEGIAADTVAAAVGTLVDHSLLTVTETAGGRRHRLLETVRRFAGERLAEEDDASAVVARHRRRYVELANDLRSSGYRPGDTEVAARLALEADDLQAALDRTRTDEHQPTPAVAGDPERDHDAGVTPTRVTRPDAEVEALAAALAWHRSERGQLARAARDLEVALAASTTAAAEVELRARLGSARFGLGDVAAAAREARHAAQLAREVPPSPGKVVALTSYARVLMLLVDEDPSEAIDVAQQAVDAAEELGDPIDEARARSTLAQALAWNGRVDEGLRRQRAALDLAMASGDRATITAMYSRFYDLLTQHPTRRRHGPRELTEEFLGWFDETGEDEQPPADVCNLLAYVYLGSGEWDRAEQVIDRAGEHHLEGYERTWNLMTRATLRWMQGRTAEARTVLRELERLGVNPRWYHDYLPLRAEVAADEAKLDEVLAVADRYLAVDVDASEESKKLGVLVPAVRARVDAALAASDADVRDEHLGAADDTIALMRELLERFPPPVGGSQQLETHTTYLVFAEAERSRAAGGDPERWREAMERSDVAYSRVYAGWRLVEALATHDRRAAAAELPRHLEEASTMGADGIRDRLVALADQLELRSDVPG